MEKKKIRALEVENSNKMAAFRKKMLDFLKNEHSDFGSNSNKQSELNSKLTLLHVTELIKELEFQSIQIEELLEEKDSLKRQVINLTNDIKIHMEVENSIQQKSNNFKNQLRSLSKPISIRPTPILPLQPKFIGLKNNSNKSFNSVSNNSSSSELSKRQITLTKELLSKEKEKENYRMKYETAQSKLRYYNTKYGNLFKLFETALDKIYNEHIVDSTLFINIEEYKSCNFEKLTWKEQYSILVLIIKYILPQVDQELLSSEITKVKLSKVKPKLYLGNKNSIGLTATLTDQYNSKIALRKSLINESNSTLNSSERLSYRNRDNIAKTQTLSDFLYQIKKKKLRIEDSKLLLDTISILQ